MTPRMRQTLQVIADYNAAHGGVSPTLREIGAAINVRPSFSTVEFLLMALIDDGYLKSGGMNRHRSSRITPEGHTFLDKYPA